jgi:L-threonylcarbamoyladenylate synthase
MAADEEVARAAAIIRGGGLVAFPTETVYGLGANALSPQAVARIFEAKKRPRTSPLIVHVADIAMARSVAAEWPELASTLAAHFWPGPLTLVVKKAESVPDAVSAGLNSVGIRMPAHPLALELIRRSAVPIAAPSANRFTQLSPTTAEHVRQGLGESVDLILDGGPTTVGIESTVVSLVRPEPTILRPGMITIRDLEDATGRRWTTLDGAVNVRESPGLHARHYSPRTPFYVLKEGCPEPPGRGRFLEMPLDPASYAAALYAEMHRADAEGWGWIAVREPPETAEWQGIRDRVKRAALHLD